MLPGGHAFFGFVLGFLTGFFGSSLILIIPSLRRENVFSEDRDHLNNKETNDGSKPVTKQDRHSR
jgi:hypothetical protein